MTGIQFWSYLQQKLDKAYSAYLDNTKANSLIAEALTKTVEKMWMRLPAEKEDDEMFPFMVKNETILTPAGTLATTAFTQGYMHLIRMAFNYEDAVAYTAVSNGVYTSNKHTLRKNQTVVISGSTNGTNGTYTVTKVRGNTFTLPVTTDGTIKVLRTVEARQRFGDRKETIFHATDKLTPGYEATYIASVKTFTLSPAPASVKVDYVRTPPVTIDVASATNLSTTYSEKMLYRIMDEAVVIFGSQTKDYQTKQSAQQDIVENP